MSDGTHIEFLGLVADHKREIRDGSSYDKYFPSANMKNASLKRNGTVADTVTFMADIVNTTLDDTKKIAKVLYATDGKKFDLEQSTENIWNFCFHYMQYELDAAGKEQLRRPARAWADGNKGDGVDCDCFSIFVSSILTNLRIPHYFRITAYDGGWQHVYVIVPKKENANLNYGSGDYITIDPVLNNFNEEKSFSKKRDYDMTNHNLSGIPIEYLEGIDDDLQDVISGADFQQTLSGASGGIDPHELLDSILTHLVKTKNAIEKNPNSVVTQGGAETWLKMLNYAIDNWNNPAEREKALDTLEKEEAKWNLTLLGNPADEDGDNFGVLGIGLGKVKLFSKIKDAVNHAGQAIASGAKKLGANAEHFAKQAVKAIVRYNPLTLAARGGYLLALKINLFGIATKLKSNPKALAKIKHMFVDVLQGKESNLQAAIDSGASKKMLGRTPDDLALAACCSGLGGPEVALIPAIVPIIETIDALRGVGGLSGDDDLPKEKDKAGIIKKMIEWLKGKLAAKKLAPGDLDPGAAKELAEKSGTEGEGGSGGGSGGSENSDEGFFNKVGSFYKKKPVVAYSLTAAVATGLFFGIRAIVKKQKEKKKSKSLSGTTKQYRRGKRIADKFLPPGSQVKAITYSGVSKK